MRGPFHEKELDMLVWQDQAPLIESSSYLMSADGSSLTGALGREVVFVKAGYFDQCKKLGLPATDPRWTSPLLRRWQGSSLCMDQSSRILGGVGYCSLGPLEHCKVVKVTFHRDRTVQDNGAMQHSGDSAASFCTPLESLPCEDRETDANVAHEVSGFEFSQVHQTNSDQNDHTVEIVKGSYFVRVYLQRLGQKGQKLTACMTVVDHYVDLGVGEFIIPRAKYLHRAKRPWKEGDRVEMYWAQEGSRLPGEWWEGDVVGFAKRGRNHPLYSSPWASVKVEWLRAEPEEKIGFISPWELSRPTYASRSEEEKDTDTEAGTETDFTEEQAGGSRSQRKRRKQPLHTRRRVAFPWNIP